MKTRNTLAETTPTTVHAAGPAAAAPAPVRVADFLRSVDLFTALDDADIAKLAACARQRPCRRGETVLMQNDPAGDHLYLIAEGEAAVVIEGHDGKETIAALLGRGDFFGEMSLLDESPRGATVRVTETARLITLRREDVLRSLQAFPGMALTLMREMARRLRQSNAKVAGLAHQRVERRVAQALLHLFEEKGVRLKDESGRRCIILRNRPTQQQLAEMAGTSRETVSRTLTQWARKGWVREYVRDLFLLDEAALRAF